MIKYKACGDTIEKMEVIKETKNFIVFEADKIWFKNGERRESKESEYYKYFDSFEDAKAWLIARQEKKISELKERIEIESRILYQVKNLQNK